MAIMKDINRAKGKRTSRILGLVSQATWRRMVKNRREEHEKHVRTNHKHNQVCCRVIELVKQAEAELYNPTNEIDLDTMSDIMTEILNVVTGMHYDENEPLKSPLDLFAELTDEDGEWLKDV